jgi:hypothetical protein
MKETFVPAARPIFAGLAAAALLAGLYLFLFPATLATLPAPANQGNPWPWPIGPLALRFVGALFAALADSAALVAPRPDRPTLLAFACATAIGTTWFLLHIMVGASRIDWLRPLAYAWTGVIALGWVGSLLAARLLWPAPPPQDGPAAPRSVRWIPILIAVLTGPVGVLMFFFPEIGRARWPWDLGDNVNVQLFGALFLSVCCAALWSWRQPSWHGYDRLYPGAATFSIVALIAALLHWRLFDPHPLAKWIFLVVYFIAGVLGYYPFVRQALRGRGKSHD